MKLNQNSTGGEMIWYVDIRKHFQLPVAWHRNRIYVAVCSGSAKTKYNFLGVFTCPHISSIANSKECFSYL